MRGQGYLLQAAITSVGALGGMFGAVLLVRKSSPPTLICHDQAKLEGVGCMQAFPRTDVQEAQ